MGGWKKRIVLTKISKYAILICLALSAILAGFSVYGTKSGNFIISVDNQSVRLSLSMNEDRSENTERLQAEGLVGQRDATYADIPDDIASGFGVKNDFEGKRYLAFSFWLMNLSDRAVDYDVVIRLRDSKKGAEKAARVLIATGEDFKNARVYGIAEETPEAQSEVEGLAGYAYADFAGPAEVLRERVTNFAEGEAVKYTVVMWLEGWDPDCNDSILSGSVKLSMEFIGY